MVKELEEKEWKGEKSRRKKKKEEEERQKKRTRRTKLETRTLRVMDEKFKKLEISGSNEN